jgi:hypothetical protein
MDRPILNRGQHRVRAHGLAFPENRRLPFTPQNVMVGGMLIQ